MNLKFWKKTMKKSEAIVALPLPEKRGYFNGLCPVCQEHIGVWVWKEYYRKNVKTLCHYAIHCPCCKNEVYELIEPKLIDWGRL